MDLLSLPSEMLASVLKYNKNLLEIRKISAVVDLTVKRFRIPTTKFSSLLVSPADGGIQVYLTPSFPHPVKEFVRYHSRDEPLLNILQYYFSKMDQLSGEFVVYGSLNCCVISEEIATLLLEQRLLKISKLDLSLCELNFNMQLLRRILTTFKIRKLHLVLLEGANDYRPFSDEIFEGLQFDELHLAGPHVKYNSELTLNGLKQICSRKLPRHLSVHLKDVNAQELVKFLKETLISWDLTVWDENERFVKWDKNLMCFDNHEMKVCTFVILNYK